MSVNGQLILAAVVGIAVGWFAKVLWDMLLDWWFEASGGWLKDVFALIGVIAVCVIGWQALT